MPEGWGLQSSDLAPELKVMNWTQLGPVNGGPNPWPLREAWASPALATASLVGPVGE